MGGIPRITGGPGGDDFTEEAIFFADNFRSWRKVRRIQQKRMQKQLKRKRGMKRRRRRGKKKGETGRERGLGLGREDGRGWEVGEGGWEGGEGEGEGKNVPQFELGCQTNKQQNRKKPVVLYLARAPETTGRRDSR
jgi:hypothetical protein